MSKIKLFFIPHAGGSAMGYMVMKRYLDTNKIEPVPLELAGRGRRIRESCFTDVTSCVEDLYQMIKPQIEEGDYAIFGHSLGALLTYELVHYIRKKKERLPVCIFFSGRISPGAVFPIDRLSVIENDDEFLEQFGRWQALPKEVLENTQIRSLMLPVIRADVKMAEDYQFIRKEPLDQDLYIFYGKDDILVTADGLDSWKNETTKHVNNIAFPGDHFYFHECAQMTMEKINEVLLHKS